MCAYFSQRMENDRGDLADVVRSGGWIGGAFSSTPSAIPAFNDRHLPSDPSASFPSDGISSTNDFGDPFASLYDPLLDELTGIEFFNNNSGSSNNNNGGEGDGGIVIPQKLLMGEAEMKKPRTRSIMPRVFRLASAGSVGIKAFPLSPPEEILVGEMMKVSSGVCSVDDGGVQIPSTRTLGIKRRKNQVKRVVCIPAPAAASSRPSGEVVPSDLWAWRKYGQKPIKGSPYPRGYYRCSSSKGCSARKQVERSRTNPNMLVVTYTSEHNHPWPTQRNALAGSTRSQAATCRNIKNISTAGALRIRSDALKEAEDPPGRKEEEETGSGSINDGSVKEEAITAAAGDDDGSAADVGKGGAILDDDRCADQQIMSCKLQEADDCLFTDLAEVELESDPMSLIFSKVLLRSKPAGENSSDALSMFN